MPIANSDRIPEEFIPGCESGVPNLAPGSQGAVGPAADSVPAGPVSLPQLGTWQPSSRTWDRAVDFGTSTSRH